MPASLISDETNRKRPRTTRASSELSLQTLHRRAIEAAIWGMPIVSVDAMRQAFFRDAAAGYGDIVFWSKTADWKIQTTALNATARYVYFNFNLKNGPLVLDVPPAIGPALHGSLVDAWQVPVSDVGPHGTDQGTGAKYVLLPPNYTGKIPLGHIPLSFRTFNGYALMRTVPAGPSYADLEKAIALVKKLSVCPLPESQNPPEQRFIDMSGQLFDGIVRFDHSLYVSLSRMVNEEPLLPRDLAIMGQLRVLGIERDKPFEPDPFLRAILDQAAREAHLWFVAGASLHEDLYWADGRWTTPSSVGAETAFSFETDHYLDIDRRAAFFFKSHAALARLAKAPLQLDASSDSEGRPLNGDHDYRLRIPPKVPASQSWEATVYDAESFAFLRHAIRLQINPGDHGLQKNVDGSFDLYFGAAAPSRKESNWIQTTPGKNWVVALRFHGPEKPLFDKTWQLPDIELLPTAQARKAA